ncbi:hypothetical protein CHU98_g9821 [Xylaria longipes]|nr:hypothetical protein CHU98_g9821 [Xylaria longipes]
MSLSRSAPRYDDGLEIVQPSTLEPATGRGSDAHYGHAGVPYKTYTDYQANPRPDTPRRRRIVCVMPTSTSILAIALIAVVVAAGIGGGVGGSIAVNNAKRACANATVTSSSASTTPAPTTSPAPSTATTSSVFAVQTNVLLPLDCPGLDSAPQSSTFAHQTSTFQMYCHRSPIYDMDEAILSITGLNPNDNPQGNFVVTGLIDLS